MDLSKTIEAKSDQLTAEDLLAGARVLKITSVSECECKSKEDRPVAIRYEGDNGKPYKPCKTMRRLLVAAWTKHGSAYIGRSMQVFNDPSVKWGGEEVGGIRISHLSNINETLKVRLLIAKGKRKTFIVEPLKMEPSKTIEQQRDDCLAAIKAKGVDVTADLEKKIADAKDKAELTKIYKEFTSK